MSEYIERYWRDAMPADAIKEPPMVARFRMYGDVPWTFGELHGTHAKDGRIWFDKRFCNSWTICQVYDAPDPGEGWRLIDVDKDKPQFSDEYYLPGSKTWTPRDHVMAFSTEQSYRRRIEPPKPKYVPFTWEDREQLRGRWVTWKHDNGLMIESQIDHINQHKDGGLWFKSHDAKWLLLNAIFIDTGEPVGKRVQ